MVTKKVRVVHFLNQFFGGLGGEEKANLEVQVIQGAVGPGRILRTQLGDHGEVVATIVAGDNYFAENTERARKEVFRHIKELKPDVVVAGPAFNAGRYGMNCGEFTSGVTEHLGIPGVTAMHTENPGVSLYRKATYIIPTGDSAEQMGQAVIALSKFAVKLGTGKELGPAAEEGYIPRGIRRAGLADRPAWERATETLLARLQGKPFISEIPVLIEDRVLPAHPIKVAEAKLATVVTSGLVPPGNPDGMRFGGSVKWGRYSIEGLSTMVEREWVAIHGGFDTTYVNRNPNYSVPLDVLHEMEQQGGVIGSLLPYFYSTTGNGTSDQNSKRMAQEIAQDMRKEGVNAALLVST